MSYVVDPEALSAAAPKFGAIATDYMSSGRGVADATASLCDALGDAAVVTSVGSAVSALLGDLQLVHGGLAHLASALGSNAEGYAGNEQRTQAQYRGAQL
jgi:hypothetical protein